VSYRASDISGSLFSLISTLLFVRVNIWAWPVGIVAILIDGTLYWYKGLYADVGKESVYFVMMWYGWYAWLYGGQQQQALPVSALNSVQRQIYLISAIIATLAVATLLHFYTDSKVPFLDSTTTVMSLLGQWLTCRKKIECWAFFLVADVLYSGLYFYKGLPWHGVLFGVYIAFAVSGYWQWNKLRKRELAWFAY